MSNRVSRPVPLKKIIDSLIESYGIKNTLSQYKIFNVWENVVGDQIAKVAKPEVVKYGELYLKVNDNVWRHELFYMKSEILEKIKKFDPETKIRDIKLI